jgi:hypothetical protein
MQRVHRRRAPRQLSPEDLFAAAGRKLVRPLPLPARRRLGATTIWALINTGELRPVRFGRRVMVEVASIHEAITRRLAAGSKADKAKADDAAPRPR